MSNKRKITTYFICSNTKHSDSDEKNSMISKIITENDNICLTNQCKMFYLYCLNGFSTMAVHRGIINITSNEVLDTNIVNITLL
jgi:hypothetical protein